MIAEGLARNILGDTYVVQSAGSKPTKLNPLAVQVMTEIGIDIANHAISEIEHFGPLLTKDGNYYESANKDRLNKLKPCELMEDPKIKEAVKKAKRKFQKTNKD